MILLMKFWVIPTGISYFHFCYKKSGF